MSAKLRQEAEENRALLAVLRRAQELTAAMEENSRYSSGEYKRHNVYAQLLKEYPEQPKRNLSFAIELALR